MNIIFLLNPIPSKGCGINLCEHMKACSMKHQRIVGMILKALRFPHLDFIPVLIKSCPSEAYFLSADF